MYVIGSQNLRGRLKVENTDILSRKVEVYSVSCFCVSEYIHERVLTLKVDYMLAGMMGRTVEGAWMVFGRFLQIKTAPGNN